MSLVLFVALPRWPAAIHDAPSLTLRKSVWRFIFDSLRLQISQGFLYTRDFPPQEIDLASHGAPVRAVVVAILGVARRGAQVFTGGRVSARVISPYAR